MRLQSLKPVFFAIALAVSSLGGFKAAYSQTTPHSVEPYAPSADDIVLLMTNDQADRYAETLYNDVMSTDPTKKTVVSFAHFTDEGRAINPMLERAITTVERKLYFIGQSHRLVVERHVIAKDEFEDYVRKKLSEAGEFNQLHYRVKYKEELGVDPTPEMTRLAEDMVKPASVWKRMKQSVGNLFGIRGGLTIRAHYSYPVNASAHAVRKKRTEHTWKYRLKLGAITASIAAASFSGVVAGPVGFLDFMGPTHLGSTAALAGWVLTCLYNFDRIQLFKNQGRTLEVDPTKKGDEPNSVAIGTSRKTYAGLTIIQESVINALITAILLGPSAMFGPEWATIWGVFVLANAVTGGLAYLPFESYSAGLNDRSASLRSEGEAAQKRGEIHAQTLMLEAERLAKRSGQLTFAWWNVIYPIFVKWLPFLVLLGTETGSEGAKWALSNSVALAFVGYYISSIVYQLAGLYRDKINLMLHPELSPCETLMTVRQE